MSDTPRTDNIYPPALLEKGWLAHGDSWGWGDLKRATDLCRTLERELSAAEAKLAEVQRDAERYRIARSGKGIPDKLIDLVDEQQIDAAIDAARGQT